MLSRRVSVRNLLCKWEGGRARLSGLLPIQGKAGAAAPLNFFIETERCDSASFNQVLESREDILIFPPAGNNLFFTRIYSFRKEQIKAPPILELSGLHSEHMPVPQAMGLSSLRLIFELKNPASNLWPAWKPDETFY